MSGAWEEDEVVGAWAYGDRPACSGGYVEKLSTSGGAGAGEAEPREELAESHLQLLRSLWNPITCPTLGSSGQHQVSSSR